MVCSALDIFKWLLRITCSPQYAPSGRLSTTCEIRLVWYKNSVRSNHCARRDWCNAACSLWSRGEKLCPGGNNLFLGCAHQCSSSSSRWCPLLVWMIAVVLLWGILEVNCKCRSSIQWMSMLILVWLFTGCSFINDVLCTADLICKKD